MAKQNTFLKKHENLSMNPYVNSQRMIFNRKQLFLSMVCRSISSKPAPIPTVFSSVP